MPTPKERNNSWSAETTRWGESFIIRCYTEGAEDPGDIAHVNATHEIDSILYSDETEFSGGNIPDSPGALNPPSEGNAQFAAPGVEMLITLEGTAELIDAEFNQLVDSVGEALGDEWVEDGRESAHGDTNSLSEGCPHCGSEDIDAGSVQEHPDEPPVGRATCNSCGAELI